MYIAFKHVRSISKSYFHVTHRDSTRWFTPFLKWEVSVSSSHRSLGCLTYNHSLYSIPNHKRSNLCGAPSQSFTLPRRLGANSTEKETSYSIETPLEDPASSELLSASPPSSVDPTDSSEEVPDLNWFVDPPPDHPPRWLRQSDTQTGGTEITLKDLSPTSIQDYLLAHDATDVTIIDLRLESTAFDTMIVATLAHPGHLASVVRLLKLELKKLNTNEIYIEGLDSKEWVVLDLEHTMIHLFIPAVREEYAIDTLWKNIKASQADDFDAVETSANQVNGNEILDSLRAEIQGDQAEVTQIS